MALAAMLIDAATESGHPAADLAIDRGDPLKIAEDAATLTHVAHAVVAFYEGGRNHGIGALLTNNVTIRASLLQIRAPWP